MASEIAKSWETWTTGRRSGEGLNTGAIEKIHTSRELISRLTDHIANNSKNYPDDSSQA
jgi:hypothetical protein